MPVFEKRSILPVPLGDLYAWHARPGAFERLTPPWQRLRVVERTGGIADGDRLVFEYGLGPVKRRWVAVHRDHVEGAGFTDVQEAGPFARWEHRHRFAAEPEGSSVLEDHVEYELPGPRVGTRRAEGIARRQVDRLFAFRHRRTRDDLLRHAEYRERPPLRVAITGGSGFIGGALTAFLTAGGHDVLRLTRRRDPGEGWAHWDPSIGTIDAAALEGVDAIVHLAGTSISGLWTDKRRREILASRRQGTELIALTAATLARPPRVIVSASAVGWYGDRGEEDLTEESGPGEGFLAEVCRAWEDTLAPAREAGIRVVSMRFGLVFGGAGGMLAMMLPAFKLGAGARFGRGDQWMSWVAVDDVLGAILMALQDESLAGAVNVSAPVPVTNRDFTATLGRVLRRPALLAAPRPLLERGLGEMGQDLLLTSQRVRPARLTAAGFTWLFPDLESALRFELGR
jgi:uncharacterized protein (TIGR01777 family)